MLFNLFIFLFCYYLIPVCIIGYGFFFLRLNQISFKEINFGYAGLSGLFLILIYSYVSNLILPHSTFHNLIFLTIGIILFLFFFKLNYSIFKKEIFFYLIVFTILLPSIFIYKNHDDFAYYHFPYTFYLTQSSFNIGVGQFNHGFRTPSSIFYLNSLLYLPFVKYYLLNFSALFILGFANIIFVKKLIFYFKKLRGKVEFVDYTKFLIIFSFIFVNIFFYRIGEHGTDRSAQIIIFILIISMLEVFYTKKINNIELLYLYVLLGLIISLKAFYILYLVLFIPLFLFVYDNKKNLFESLKFFLKNKIFISILTLILLILFTYFINTGCLIYPIKFSCFENLSWSIPLLEVSQMNDWYKLWSKAGAGPNFRVENPEIYIQGFNWVSNWTDNYFFNKVSDFILGIIFLSLVLLLSFLKPSLKRKKINIGKYEFFTFLIILILLFEWFFNHPALRYGGYSLVALIAFIPLSIFLSSFQINVKKFINISLVLITITSFIFLGRNIHRINKEMHIYNYNILSNVFYNVEENHFRVQKQMNDEIDEYYNCEVLKLKCYEYKKKIELKFRKVIFLNN